MSLPSTTSAPNISPTTTPTRWYPSRLLSPPSSLPSTYGRNSTQQQQQNALSLDGTQETLTEQDRKAGLTSATTTMTTTTTTATTTNPYALMILNQPINKPALCALLPGATLVVCADAGGDRYREFYEEVSRSSDPERSGINGGDGNEAGLGDDGRDGDGERRQQKQQQEQDQQKRGQQKNGENQDIDSEQREADESSSLPPLLRLPDAVVGDLDSLTDETRQFWSQRGVTIVHDPDQYSTDFAKCLKWLRKEFVSSRKSLPSSSSSTHVSADSGALDPALTLRSSSTSTLTATATATNVTEGEGEATSNTNSNVNINENHNLDVLVLGGLGGRVDQGFSQIHHLIYASETRSILQGKIYLVSEQSLTFVLDQGENVIFIDDWRGVEQEDEEEPKQKQMFTEKVGIIPITGPSVISTKGLEWDVTNWSTSFGTQLSTSNHIRGDRVTVFVGRLEDDDDDGNAGEGGGKKRKLQERGSENTADCAAASGPTSSTTTDGPTSTTTDDTIHDTTHGNGDDNEDYDDDDNDNKEKTTKRTRPPRRETETGKCIFTMEFAPHFQLGSSWPVSRLS